MNNANSPNQTTPKQLTLTPGGPVSDARTAGININLTESRDLLAVAIGAVFNIAREIDDATEADGRFAQSVVDRVGDFTAQELAGCIHIQDKRGQQ